MPRLTKTLPAYRKHNSGQARVTINRRDYLLGPYGTQASKREYDRVIAEYLASGRSGSFGIVMEEYTMAMMMSGYVAHAKAYYGTGPGSEWIQIKYAIKPVKRLYASLPATEFGPVQFKAVRQAMLESERIVKGETKRLARSTINAQMKRIARMVKWAAAEGKIPASVFETLRLIPGLKKGRSTAVETSPIKPVSAEVVNATLAYLPPTVADMVRLQELIGCRPGELCKLTPGMIDRSSAEWVAKLGEHKTAHHGHERNIYFGPKAQAIVTPYLLRGENDCLFRPLDTVNARRKEAAANRVTPLSCGNRSGKRSAGLKGKNAKRQPGARYTPQAYAKAIDRAAKLAKVEHWSPNQLRHNRATTVRKQFGLEAAQVTLGHASANITQTYAERDEELARTVARKIG